jgi:hypothetical protein
MTFEKFYFITKLCEKYNEVAESPMYEDMYVTAKICWDEFSESKYYRFQIDKEGIGPAVEEYITERCWYIQLIDNLIPITHIPAESKVELKKILESILTNQNK